MPTSRPTTIQLTLHLPPCIHQVSVPSLQALFGTKAHILVGTSGSGSGSHPSATGATNGGSQSGAALAQSIPDVVTFGLVSLISGFVVVF